MSKPDSTPAAGNSVNPEPGARLTVSSATSVSAWWACWICGLLLCASSINYMDRQALANCSERITREFGLSDEQYGQLELAFGLSFAVGATVFGFLADRLPLRWLYPAVVLLWSAMGLATGFAETFVQLLLCRALLGFFEAGHWPCGLQTTRRLLPPESRTLGNSLMQSGTALGAIITPLIVRSMLTEAPGSWRPVFQWIGGIGVLWVAAWFLSVRAGTFQSTAAVPGQTADAEAVGRPTTAPSPSATDEPDARGTTATAATTATAPDRLPRPPSRETGFLGVLRDRRFWLLMGMVIAINLCWHILRVWLNKFLLRGRGYSEAETLLFVFWFNVATDIGCLSAGVLTRFLHQWGATATRSRIVVFAGCAGLTTLLVLIPWLPRGAGLLAVLLLVGMGLLGQFPCYYAFTQELAERHQGKIAGVLATVAWLATSPVHPLLGRWVDRTGSYDVPLALAGFLPLISAIAIALLWREASAMAIKS